MHWATRLGSVAFRIYCALRSEPKIQPVSTTISFYRKLLVINLANGRGFPQIHRHGRQRSEGSPAERKEQARRNELAAYLLIAMRHKILGIPQTYSRRLLNISGRKEMAVRLKEMSFSVLNEIKHLPERVTDPNWLNKLENGDGEQA